MPPSAADLWTCQLEKQRQLYNLELIPYLRTLGIQLLIKIVNTSLLLLQGKSVRATDLAFPFYPFISTIFKSLTWFYFKS